VEGEEESLDFPDYGLAPRLGPADDIPEEKKGLVEEFVKEVDEKQTRLKTRESSILAPLSLLDWTHFIGAVKLQTDSIGFVQILPIGKRSTHPFRNNVMSILPRLSQSLQHKDRPISNSINDRLVELTEESDSKKEAVKAYENKLAETGVDPEDEEQMLNFLQDPDYRTLKEESEVPEYITMFQETSVFRLEEYQGVEHLVIPLRNNPEPEEIQGAYGKLTEILKLHKCPEHGVTILLHADWLFIAPLTDSIGTVNEQELFIDPLAYAGILNVNLETHEWPQTAGHDILVKTPLYYLRKRATPNQSLNQQTWPKAQRYRRI